MKRTIFSLCLAIVCLSCDDVVDTDVIEIEEEIFISSFISPEIDSIVVNVSRTLPALNLRFDLDDASEDIEKFVIRDAQVNIRSSSGETIRLPFQEAGLIYAESTQNFQLTAGEDYFLEVTLNNEIYTASCTIPQDNIADVNQRVVAQPDEFGFFDFTLDVNFQDIPNNDNFYFLGGFYERVVEEGSIRNGLFFDLEAFQTDNNESISTIRSSVDFFPFFNFDNDPPDLLEQDLVIQVINAEQPLYQLARTRYLNSINQGDPFIELGVDPNNISGNNVTGVFAGYRYFEKRVPLEIEDFNK